VACEWRGSHHAHAGTQSQHTVSLMGVVVVNAQVDAVDDGAPSGPAESPGRVRTRAGGRSAKVREAVADACLAFLAEGRIDFTMVDVAERAGVSRKTLYRWWPTHEDVLVEGLSRHARQVTP